jgi:hypothetical protein
MVSELKVWSLTESKQDAGLSVVVVVVVVVVVSCVSALF